MATDIGRDIGTEPRTDGEESGGPDTRTLPPLTFDDEAPTMILDLRAAFAEAGPPGAPPLGIVQAAPERPGRAALAFLAVLVLIAAGAAGLVLGLASAGRAVYASVAGPPQCSAAQVTEGSTLQNWLSGVLDAAQVGEVRVVRSGCLATDTADPLTGQAATATLPVSKARPVSDALARTVGCRLGQPTDSGARFCTVTLGSRLGVVSYRPTADATGFQLSVAYR